MIIFQGVKVKFKGKESTEWQESVNQYDRKSDTLKQILVDHFGINRIINAEASLTKAGRKLTIYIKSQKKSLLNVRLPQPCV